MTQIPKPNLEALLGGSSLVKLSSNSYCVGRQVIGDLLLDDSFDYHPMPGVVLSSAVEAGATPLTMSFSYFENGIARSYFIEFSKENPKHPSYVKVDKTADYSLVLIVSESHYAFHYFKERGIAILDIYTCGDVDPRISYNYIIDFLKEKGYLRDEHHYFTNRGILNNFEEF